MATENEHENGKPVPTGEEVVDEVLRLAQEASKMPWSKLSVDSVKAHYLPTVSTRLKVPGAWRREGGNVYKAAKELGTIAASLARLQGKREVEQYIADSARQIVAQHCDLAYGDGRYCS